MIIQQVTPTNRFQQRIRQKEKIASTNSDLDSGRPFLSITALPFACKYDIISVIGLRLMADNGNLLQSLSEEDDDGAVAFGFTSGEGTCALPPVLVADEAKKALSSDADGGSV